MRKRDPIFWAATAITLVSVLLAIAFGQGFLLLMIAAYLLRPTLHSLGFARKLMDERQAQIQYRASNVGFAAMMIGNILVVLYLMGKGDHTWEMVNAVVLIALAVRALSGLLMVGDLSAAGPRILMAMGLFFCLFGVMEGGLSLESMQHTIPGLALIGLGWLGRKQPKVVAWIVFILVALFVAWLGNRALHAAQPNWGMLVTVLLIATPATVAAVCLVRAQQGPDAPAPVTPAALAFLALSLGALAAPPAMAQTKPLACTPWRNTPSLGPLCTLAHDDTVFGRPMPAGTRLRYDTAGVLKYVWFMKNTTLEGLELSGTSEGPHHEFYPDGTPKMLWLARTQDVQGVPCRPISFWTEIIRHTSAIYFHPSGRLRACRLGRAATIRGVAFSKGDRVEFDDAGKVVTAEH